MERGHRPVFDVVVYRQRHAGEREEKRRTRKMVSQFMPLETSITIKNTSQLEKNKLCVCVCVCVTKTFAVKRTEIIPMKCVFPN